MHVRESSIRSLLFAAAAPLVVTALAAASPPGAEGSPHGRSICAEEGMTASAANGASCRELGRRIVESLGTEPVYWHVSRLTAAERAAGVAADAWVVEAVDEAWVYAIGPRDALSRFGEPLASIGPLPVRPGTRYEAVSYFTTMPPGVFAAAHGHSGPEAWFLLSGAQCVETPGGTSRVRAGESMVAQPSVPMRITSTGPGTRRALSIVLRDSEQPKALASAWLPTGACHPATASRPVRPPAPSVPLVAGERAVRRAVSRAGDTSAPVPAVAAAPAVRAEDGTVSEPAGVVEPSLARRETVVEESVEAPALAVTVAPAAAPGAETVASSPAAAEVSAAQPPAGGERNGSAHFSFAGLSLDSTISEVRNRYPRSRYVGHYLYVAPEDAHDHVYGIELPDGSPAGRVRLTFEHRPNGPEALPAYPGCGEIENVLERRYGTPTGVRNFYEEASRRSDRIWEQAGERLELLCFGAPGGLQAEAVVIFAQSS